MSNDVFVQRDPEQHDESAIQELPPREPDARAAEDVKGGADGKVSLSEIKISKPIDVSSTSL